MTQKIQYTGDRWLCRVDLAASAPETLLLPAGGESTIAVDPNGGTVQVLVSCSSPADIAAGNGFFVNAEFLASGGAVSAATMGNVPSTITAVRATSTVAGARVEVAQ